MTSRILTLKEARKTFKGFESLRKLPGFPRPISETKTRKLYDSKAIDHFLDIQSGLASESAASDIEREMLDKIYGRNQGELR